MIEPSYFSSSSLHSNITSANGSSISVGSCSYRSDEDDSEKDIMEQLENMMDNSQFFKLNPPTSLPCYKNVKTGVILGQGEFGTVREVIGFPRKPVVNDEEPTLPTYTEEEYDDISSVDESECEDEHNNITVRQQHDLRKRCWRNGMARYALKSLRDNIEEEEEEDLMHVGLIDLAMEAKFLASLSHPNIIKLRGTVGVPGRQDFMLILDRLYLTLDDKFSSWKAEQRRIRSNSLLGIRKKMFKTCFRDFMMQRLVVAYDIARVLKYLHEHNIIYRDLKPENIGFDIRGDLRLFDFGLAKEVAKSDLVRLPEDYNFTGITGSKRWMAPEVYTCWPYGPSADVYSFGLLFWNIFSLKTPFAGMSLERHYDEVILNHKRPAKLKSLPKSLDIMMGNCWSSQRAIRPPFRIICSIIRRELQKLQKKQAAADLHNDLLLDRTEYFETKSLRSMEL